MAEHLCTELRTEADHRKDSSLNTAGRAEGRGHFQPDQYPGSFQRANVLTFVLGKTQHTAEMGRSIKGNGRKYFKSQCHLNVF